MGSRLSRVNRKFNIFVFMSAISLFLFLSMMESAGYGRTAKLLRDLSAAFLLGNVMMINYCMPRKAYVHSNSIAIWTTGLLLWAAWCIFEFIFGLVELRDTGAICKIGASLGFTFTYLLSARIIVVYNLKLSVLRITLILLGTIITTSYVAHLDGLHFIGRLGSILLAGGRYMNDFGFKQVNFAGFACLYFILFSIIYKAAIEEKTIGRGGVV